MLSPASEAQGSPLSLVDLLTPLEAPEFLERYWDRSHLAIQRDDPEFYGGLFSSYDLDGAIAAAQESSQDNLTLIPPPDSGRKVEKFVPNDLALDRAYNAFCQGDTLRLLAVHRTWPTLAALADALAAELSAQVNMNLYLTPVGKQGFGLHVDTHDVFVLQVEGSKEWSIYESQYRLPVTTLTHEADNMSPNTVVDESSAELIESVVLRQGDLLYMPRGVPHKARTTDEHSLHITVGVHILYWVDLLKALVEAACLSQEPLRRSLPPGFANDPKAAERLTATLQTALAGLQADAPLAQSLETLSNHLLRKQKYPADGHFASLLGLAKIGAHTLLERRGSFVCRVSRGADAATIRFGQNQVAGPASNGEAFEFIRDTRHFRVHELPGPLSDHNRVVLARRLVREGLLRPAERD